MIKAKQLEGAELDVNSVGLTNDGYAGIPKNYKPDGFDSVEDFLTDVRENYQADLDFDRENRTAALEDLKFAAGEMWDPLVLEQRKGLPCLNIHTIPQFTAQLVGDFRESRRAVKVVPMDEEDTDIASIRGDIIRGIEMQSRANRAYETGFENQVICGDGALRVTVDYARDDIFDQDIFISGIENPLSVVWDRYSMDPTGRDARRVSVEDRIPKKEFTRKWPNVEPATIENNSDYSWFVANNWIDNDSYRIIEHWRLVNRQRLLALFSNGKTVFLDDDNIEQVVSEYGPPVKTRVSWCTYAQMHLMTGFDILEGPFEYKISRLPIIRMSGRVVNIGGRRVRYGIVRAMKDSIRMRNFARSVYTEQLGYAPKAQWMAPESAVEGREDIFRNAHKSRDPLIVYNDDASAPPIRVDPPVPQQALLQMAEINAQDLKDVTGIHDASLGVRSNETSGRAIQARQREGDIAALTYYDNANEAILEAGDVINQLIPQVYDGTRVLLGLGEDQAEKFVRVNDPMNPDAIDLSVGMFKVALSTGTSYTTRRVEAAQAMMDAIQVWPNLMTVAGDLVAKAQDWPGADKLAERLRKTIPQEFLEEGDQGGIPPEVIQQVQMELETLKKENELLKTDRELKKTELEIDWYNAETQRIRALSDHEVDNQKTSLDAIKTIVDGSHKLDLEELRAEELEFKAEESSRRLASPSQGNVATGQSVKDR